MDDIKLAMLGNKEAAKRLTDAGVLVPCPGCKTRFGVAIRCTDTKAEIVCQHKFCGFRVIKTSKEGAAIALLRARKAWNTRAPLLTPTQMAALERETGKSEEGL